MDRGKHGAPLSFEDVLRELSMHARDSIVSLLPGDSLRSTRLACRSLRDLVDGSILKVSLNLREEDCQAGRRRRPLPLYRWPRCSEVTLNLYAKEVDDRLLAGDLLVQAVFGLEGGRITSIDYNSRYLDLHRLARFVGRVLLPSGAVGQRLERLSLHGVNIRSNDANRQAHADHHDPDGQAPSGRPPMQQLQTLLQRCARAEVGSLRVVDREVTAQQLDEALMVFGGSVKTLELVFSHMGSINITLSPVTPAPVAAAQGDPRPFPASIVDLALERLTASGAAGTSTAAGVAGGPADSTAADSSGGSQLDESAPRVVLLRGRLLAGLAWAPEALSAWVRHLAQQATVVAAAQQGAAAGSAAHEPPLSAFLPLPCARAVLVQCSGAAGLAAVEATAVEAAARAARAAVDPEADAGPALLQMLPIAVGVPANWRGTNKDCAEAHFAAALNQAAQGIWDWNEDNGGWSVVQRLQWLVGQRETLWGLPAVVHI